MHNEAAEPLLQPSHTDSGSKPRRVRHGCGPFCSELGEVFRLALPIIVTTMVPQVATVVSQVRLPTSAAS